MRRYYLLSGLAVWLAAAAPAEGYVAYVSNEKGNTVSVIDTDNWTVTDTIKVGQRPRGIEFTRDGKFVMVAVGDDDTIDVIDAATKKVVDTLPSGPDPELFTQDAAGKILYVANENDNTVTVIDLEKRARLGDIQVGVEPEGMAVSPDGKILINTSISSTRRLVRSLRACSSIRGRVLPSSSATAPNCGCPRRSAAQCRSSIRSSTW
jgi:YVTN family beta-propeller protein